MSAYENGGPAFPVSTSFDQESGEYGHQDSERAWQFPGMSLRDYAAIHMNLRDEEMSMSFAESVMDRDYPLQSTPPRASYWGEVAQWWAEAEAKYRYTKADAMLRAQATTTPPTPTALNAARDGQHEFKNFHRLLCERFDYTHDEIDWRRDQISLIEHIARLAKP